MRFFLISTLLLFSIIGSGAAYEYHMPVNIQPSTYPDVLMPGDQAVLAVQLQNGAAAYGVGGTGGVAQNANDAILSTPINRTTLKGTNEIKVTSNDYKDLGMIGPSDKVNIYYKIKAIDNITTGTYLLDFGVLGGYDIIPINRLIPVNVDTASVNIARADIPTKPVIDLNVANPRKNTVNAVTIVPSGPGIRFSPDQYYIGNMDPDEVFTISFAVDSLNPMKPITNPINVSFVAKFENGDNWHQSEPYFTAYLPPRDTTNRNNYLLPGAIVAVLIIAAGGFYLYRRKKNGNKPT